MSTTTWLARPRSILGVAFFALAGCGGGAEWGGTIADSAGIAIVTNPAGGVWSSSDRPTVERELDIGSAEGEPEYQFGQIAGLDVTDDAVYVFDQQSRTVRVFSHDGQFLRQMGRPGSGPGELSQAAVGVLVGPGDTVFVPDIMQQRMTRYTSTGEPAGSFSIPFTEGISVRWDMTADGMLLQQTRAVPVPGSTEMPTSDYLFRRDRQGAIRDTLLRLPAGQSFQIQQSGVRMRLFEPEPIWAVMPDGRVLYGMNSEYSIRVHSPDGALQRIIRRPFEKRPVSEADRQAFLDALREAIRSQLGGAGSPAQAQAVQQFLDGVGFADTYPAFASMMGGPEGSIWVQRIQTADDVKQAGAEFNAQDVGAPTWDVFDAEGRYLGPVELPARFQPIRLRGNGLWGIWRDELDVQHVLRLRLAGGFE